MTYSFILIAPSLLPDLIWPYTTKLYVPLSKSLLISNLTCCFSALYPSLCFFKSDNDFHPLSYTVVKIGSNLFIFFCITFLEFLSASKTKSFLKISIPNLSIFLKPAIYGVIDLICVSDGIVKFNTGY